MNRTILQWAVIVLAAVTALIHLALGAAGVLDGLDALSILFILNGIGFFMLLAAVFLNVPFFAGRRALAHYLLIAFAAVTLVAYFVVNGFVGMGIAAIISKVAEALLIVATFLHLRAVRESV